MTSPLAEAASRLIALADQRVSRMGGKAHTRILTDYDLKGLREALALETTL